MIVYVLESTMDSQSRGEENTFCILGAYSTQEKAEQAGEIAKENGWMEMIITPYELDANPT